MKKTVKIIACAALVLTITGCKNKTSPSNGNENVISLTKDNFSITVDDLYGSFEVIVFESIFNKCSASIEEEKIVLVERKTKY